VGINCGTEVSDEEETANAILRRLEDGLVRFMRFEPRTRSHVSRVPTILCIDDEVLGLEIRKVVLEREGYLVYTATDGPTGIRIFRQQPIDAVVLDFAMPGMNGGAVAMALREIRPNVPILLLSAYLSLPEEVQSLVTLVANKGDGALALLGNVKRILESSGDQP
jgi:CheY-like chemotaxis protein